MENQNWKQYARHYENCSIEELSDIALNAELYHDETRWAVLQLIEQKGQELSPSQKELIEQFKIKATKKQALDQVGESEKVVVELFSPRAIFGFSIFFSIILGGVLMFSNLKKMGKLKQAISVLVASVLFMFLPLFVVPFVGFSQWVVLLVNFLGALFFVEYYWKNYLGPDLVYKRRPVMKVVFICFLLYFVLTFVLMQFFPESIQQLG